MTVKEFKEVLGRMKDDSEVYICVNEPAGFVCTDGAVVEVKNVFVDSIGTWERFS